MLPTLPRNDRTMRRLSYFAIFACLAILSTARINGADQVANDQLPGTTIQLPPEGRWSIATDWKDGWPAEWHHAQPDTIETIGEWTFYHGRIRLAEGDWLLRDCVRPLGNGLVECRRRWQWTGKKRLDHVTLSVRWQVETPGGRPFLPSISYYDNPAGQKVDRNRVPVIGKQPGCKGFYEEHRFSMPFAAVEAENSGKPFVAALHSRPCPMRCGHYEDQWWSLGLEYREKSVELALLSGAVATNGHTGIIKVGQRKFFPYSDGYLTVVPGAVFEKRFYLQLAPAESRGSGFRPVVWQSVKLFDPFATSGFPQVESILRLKFLDTARRWHEDDQCAGVDAFPDSGKNRPWIDLGWAGQSEAAAYPLMILGKSLGIADAHAMAQKSLDFICSSPFDQRGFSTRYNYDAHRWLGNRNVISQGQAMNNILSALQAARNIPGYDVARWETFLRRASGFHAARLLKEDWRPRSTNEAFLIAPLARAAALFDEPRYLQAARRAADHYGRRHLSMDEPYWGGTIDARCEDKEGAAAAMQGFLAMYEATGEKKYLDWATHAADVVISYVYVWDVPMPPGRIADHAFQSRGWTSVSVQNMHLDVWGVLCTPDLWRIGHLTGRKEYQDMARLMLTTCGQFVDPLGSQGEQLQQTNFGQHYEVHDLKGVRGDYVESWSVYWITAHFLTTAARLEEMGVPWHRW